MKVSLLYRRKLYLVKFLIGHLKFQLSCNGTIPKTVAKPEVLLREIEREMRKDSNKLFKHSCFLVI